MNGVTLVQMPYASVQRPSIALGLLKRYLVEAGIPTRVLYANLDWAEEIGLDIYRLSECTVTPDLVGEWTFAGAAFPDFAPDHEAYFRLVKDNATFACFLKIRELHPGVTLPSVLMEVRRRANGFVDLLARRVLADRPRIVGCTSAFHQHCASLALLRRIRELDPGVVTMMGGANCEGPMGRATHAAFEWVDFVVSGEADGFIAELCANVLRKGRALPAADLPDGVRGPAHRENGGAERARRPGLIAIGTSPPLGRAVVHDLDRTAIPDYDDFFEALGRSALAPYVQPCLLVETSRGCWWGAKHHCTFCGLNGSGMVYRSKSAERVVAEIEYLTERHGVRQIEAVDNILDMTYLDTVLPRLAERKEPLSMFYEVKANLKRKHVEALARAGVRAVQPGIESLHAETLKLIDKGTSALINVQLMKWAREMGVEVHWGFLVHIPGERDEWYEEMAEWLPLVQHLQPPIGVAKLRFDRFSVYHERPERWGLELVPYPTYACVYPVSPAGLADLAYFFESKDGLAGDDGRLPEAAAEGRPGLQALKRRLADWKRLSRRPLGQRPGLRMTDDGESIHIRDTRSVATRGRHVLRGLTRLVYLACDEAMTADSLVAALHRRFDRAESWTEIAPVVDDLVADRLILRVESRYLSLATWEGRAGAPRWASPSGSVDFDRAARDLASRSPAVACRPSPLSVTVRELFGATT